MKFKFTVAAVALAFAVQAPAAVLFSDSFQTDLSQWSPSTSGVINSTSGGSALSFGTTTGGGDLRGLNTYASTGGHFHISFDYLGTCGQGQGHSCGGFLGFDNPAETWLAGSGRTAPPIRSARPAAGRQPKNYWFPARHTSWVASRGRYGNTTFRRSARRVTPLLFAHYESPNPENRRIYDRYTQESATADRSFGLTNHASVIFRKVLPIQPILRQGHLLWGALASARTFSCFARVGLISVE